jgi:aldehyde:ferredoxin oxidoreductase
VFSLYTDDSFARLFFEDREIPGPSFEYEMYTLATGHELSEQEFYRTCERVVNLDRCIQIRHFGRSREDDERIIPYFATPEIRINPFIGEPVAMNPGEFRNMLSEYYALRGWDTETGRPTEEKLRELGLGWVRG